MSEMKDLQQRELSLLGDLDNMPTDSWHVIVRWMAPKLAVDNNPLLAEIVLRRARIEAGRHAGESVDASCERMALMFSRVGLKLVVA